MLLTVSGALAAENKKNKPEIKIVDNYIAVLDFEVRAKDKDISRPLADSVIHEFSQSDKYEVIERGNMNKILKEQKFQMSGCVAQECKVEAGQILGVGKIVNGSVGLVGKTYYLTLQLIDVKTGKVELSAEDKCKCELDELLDSTKRLAKKLLGEKVEQPVTTAPKPSTVAETKVEAIARAEATAKAKAEAEEIAKVEAKKHELKIITAAIDPAMVSPKVFAPDGRFEKLINGEVRDKQSGLDWYAGPDKNTGWDEANARASGLKVDGGGWRIPTLEELKDLYQKGTGSRNMIPLLETSGWWIWAGGMVVIKGGVGGRQWALDFDNGSELLDINDNFFYKRGFAVRARR